MNANTYKINSLFSTINFVVIFVGYQLVTTIFLPTNSDFDSISRSITVPFRGFALLLMLFVFFINIKSKKKPLSFTFKILLFYWFILIFRIFYDVFLRSDVFLTDTFQLWLYIFGICLPAILAIWASFDKIDIEKSFIVIWYIIAFVLILTLFNNQLILKNYDETVRIDANTALNTISYGHLGAMSIYLSFFFLKKKKTNIAKKIVIFLVMAIAFYSVLRAGSRGPILGLIVVLLFWIFSRGRNPFVGLIVTTSFIALIAIFIDPILNLIGDITPVMELRLRQTIYEGDTSDRAPKYIEAFRAFVENPFFGKQFAFFDKHGDFIYSHNIILDSLMGLGFLGGITMLYILIKGLNICYLNIKHNSNYYWISLVLVHTITANMLSGAFYQDQLLSVLLAYHFLSVKNNSTISFT